MEKLEKMHSEIINHIQNRPFVIICQSPQWNKKISQNLIKITSNEKENLSKSMTAQKIMR